MKGKRWTKEEVKYLEKWWGRKTRTQIAKHLKKSVSAVKGKAICMGLGTQIDTSDLLNLCEVEQITGVHKSTISRIWCDKDGLKCRRDELYTWIAEKDLQQFMKEHPEKWDATKCDYYMFYSFPWFIEKLEHDREYGHNFRYNAWSEYEVARLKALKHRGLTNREIADLMGRTRRSICGKWWILQNEERERKDA